MDPALIRQLDPTLHEKSRLSIASVLKARGPLSFIELRDLLEMTDGNLSVHIKTLERKGYLLTSKRRQDGKIRTTCRLSENGRRALDTYLADLETIVGELRDRSPRRRRRARRMTELS